jgi:hypothetical protein
MLERKLKKKWPEALAKHLFCNKIHYPPFIDSTLRLFHHKSHRHLTSFLVRVSAISFISEFLYVSYEL